MSQTKPREPVAMKAQRQPQWTVIHGTTRGVTMAPMFEPALKIPVANARSFFGNHSATALILAGKTPASLNPSAERARTKPPNDPAMAWAMEATLQKAIAKA